MSRFNIAKEIRKAWSTSAPLTATTLLMFAAFIASLAGILLDHRLITGVPAWLKPAKFAISTGIFSGTLAWLYRYLGVASFRSCDGMGPVGGVGIGSCNN
jgi:hypothetical protein